MYNGREDQFLVKVTARVVDQSFIPALEEVAQSPFPGKVAFAMVRNHERAIAFMRKVDRERFDLLRVHAQLDGQGNVIVDTEATVPNQAKFADDDAKERFNNAVNALLDEPRDLVIQRVKRDEIEKMHTVRPVALMMLAPMFFSEEEPEEVATPAPTMSVVEEQE